MSLTAAAISAAVQVGLSAVSGRKAKDSAAELAMLNLEKLDKRYDQNIEMIDQIYTDNLQKTMYESTLERFNYTEAATDQLGKSVSDIAVSTSEGADIAGSSFAGQSITEDNAQFARNINTLIAEQAAEIESLANTKYNQSTLQASSYENSAIRLSNQLKRTERTSNNLMLSGAIKGLSTMGMGFANNSTPIPETPATPTTPTAPTPETNYLKSSENLYDEYIKPTWGWV